MITAQAMVYLKLLHQRQGGRGAVAGNRWVLMDPGWSSPVSLR